MKANQINSSSQDQVKNQDQNQCFIENIKPTPSLPMLTIQQQQHQLIHSSQAQPPPLPPPQAPPIPSHLFSGSSYIQYQQQKQQQQQQQIQLVQVPFGGGIQMLDLTSSNVSANTILPIRAISLNSINNNNSNNLANASNANEQLGGIAAFKLVPAVNSAVNNQTKSLPSSNNSQQIFSIDSSNSLKPVLIASGNETQQQQQTQLTAPISIQNSSVNSNNLSINTSQCKQTAFDKNGTSGEGLASLEEMSVNQLREECARRKLPKNGVKQKLIDRLKSNLMHQQTNGAAAAAVTVKSPDSGINMDSSPSFMSCKHLKRDDLYSQQP